MYFPRQCVLSIFWTRLPSRRVELVSKERTGHTSSAGSVNTTWEVADVRKPLTSTSRLLDGGHKLVLDEKPRIQRKNGDTIPLGRTGGMFAVRLWIPKGFPWQG